MLHVVLPVHDRCAVTAGFVRALRAQTYTDYRLLLIDVGCTDGTADMVSSLLPARQLVVLHGNGQLWWAGALQHAYEHLSEHALQPDDAVLIINDDVTFAPGFLGDGMTVLAANQGACIQALATDGDGQVVDRGTVADTARLRFHAAQPGEAPNCLSTRGLLMDAATFLHSGGFRPRWLPHYLSDYEFTLRLRRQGVRLMVDPRFALQASLEMTGLSAPPTTDARAVWTNAFSNRAKFNPKHWSAFVLMVCPPHRAPMHLLRIWAGFARTFLSAALSGRRLHERT